MADKAIGDLDRSERLYTADLIPIEQGGNAKAISGAVLAAFARERGAQAAEGAEAYAEAAEESAQKAEAWSKHPPYIGENGNWWVYDISTQRFVDSGVDASITVRIADVAMLSEGTAPYVTNTGTATDPIYHLFIPVGATGATGNGIQSIHFNNDYTLTITYTNGTSYRTGAIRGATGNGIADVQLNPDYTLTINYTDGDSDTTTSIRGAKGEKGDTGNDGVSPNVTISTLSNGHRVTITDKTHPTGQSFNVLDGNGAGDMLATTYDPNGNIAAAGGIEAFVDYTNDNISPEQHANIFRGENLGASVTSEQYTAIAAGTFDDLYIGDYWTIDGVNYRIADFDYWYGKGTPFSGERCTTHHVVIVPDSTIVHDAQMNNTATTEGGYIGSDFYCGANGNTALTETKAKIKAVFGQDHMLSKYLMLSNAVTNGKPSGVEYCVSEIDLMNEINVYGCHIFAPANDGIVAPQLATLDTSQFALFRIAPKFIAAKSGSWRYWLRDVISSTDFAMVGILGLASHMDASARFNGIRPAFGLIG